MLSFKSTFSLSSFTLHWSLRKAFLSLVAILWNSAFKWVYFSFSHLLFASLIFIAVYKASSNRFFLLSDRMWSTWERNGKPLQYSCPENSVKSTKRQKDRTLKDELPRSVGDQYATSDQRRNNSRKNERMHPKLKQHSFVDGTGDWSKVWCCESNIA